MTKNIPSRIGKYRIRDLLGRGATGTVYLAEDPFEKREVAIKVASKEVLNDPQFGSQYRKFFVNEASLAGRLKHPHIVEVYDAVAEDELHYIVMELVSGGTLEAYCKVENLLPVDRAVEIIFKCCRALDYASRMGLIHRDIKPANIMFDQEGEIRIADFGAALALGADQTQIMGVVGSLFYMSPEQVSDQELTHQTDIYSLGVVMYQLLTGKLPFKAKNQGILVKQILNDEPEPVSRIRPEVPGPLEAIVSRAMRKETENRYHSWNELAQDLSDIFVTLEQPAEDISDTKKYEALKKLEFFSEFNEVEIWETLRISRWGKFPADQTVLEEGKLGSSFFVVARGSLKVTKGGKLLGVLNEGDCFGEMAYIQGQAVARTASVITTTRVVLLKIKAGALGQASDNLQLKFNRKFLRIMASRLATADNMLANTFL